MDNILIVGLYRGRGSFGGVVNYINLLLKYLNKSKFKTFYFSYGKSPNWYRGEDNPSKFGYHISYIKKLIEFVVEIKRRNIQIVHINSGLSQRSLFRDGVFSLIAKIFGCRTLFFLHGWKEKEFEKIINDLIKKKITRILLKKQDAIVVSASQFKKELIDLGIESQRIFVSSTMVESEKYRSKIKKFGLPPYEVLFCANMIRSKGIYELLDAIPFVIEKYPQTRFTFVGNGKELEISKEKSKELRIRENIEFTDYVSNIEKIKFLKKAHVFAFPSHTEGFPTVILEAMAAGTPLVVTPVGGLKEVLLDGVHGKIIKSMPPQPKEIGEKIITLLSSPELMREMSENNLKDVIEKYDVKVVSSQIGQIYEKISQNR